MSLPKDSKLVSREPMEVNGLSSTHLPPDYFRENGMALPCLSAQLIFMEHRGAQVTLEGIYSFKEGPRVVSSFLLFFKKMFLLKF